MRKMGFAIGTSPPSRQALNFPVVLITIKWGKGQRTIHVSVTRFCFPLKMLQDVAIDCQLVITKTRPLNLPVSGHISSIYAILLNFEVHEHPQAPPPTSYLT